MFIRFVAFAAIMNVMVPAAAHSPASSARAASQVPAAAVGAAATVDAFHEALRKGDRAKALALLTDDALIYEAGGVERSKAEYAREHLEADAEFSKAVPSTRTQRTGGANGTFAWVASEGQVKGTFRGRTIDRLTTETMLLRRVGRTWRIAHIHWSSAAAPAAQAAAASVPLLAGSAPANGEMVQGPLRDLELRFSPPARLVEVTLAGPGGTMPMMLSSAGEQARYLLPLPPLSPGTYSVDWRAAAGGREDRGTFVFTIR